MCRRGNVPNPTIAPICLCGSRSHTPFNAHTVNDTSVASTVCAMQEFFVDTPHNTLYYVPDNGTDMSSAVVEGGVLPRILQFRGR